MSLTKTLGCLLLLGYAQAQFTTSPAATDHELLIRALSYGDGIRVDSLPGKLLTGFNLTLPAGSQLVGSIVTRATPSGAGMNVPPSVRVFFDHALLPAELKKVLAASLKSAGFQPMTQGFVPGASGGFQPSAPMDSDQWYRRNPDQVVYLMFQRVGAVTQVSLTREEPRDLTQRLRFAELRMQEPAALLPKLRPPQESSVMPQGSGGSSEDAYQSALIQTALGSDALLTHYRPQLEAAGWKLVNQAKSGALLTSIWRTKEGGVGIMTFNAAQKGTVRANLTLFNGQ